MVQGEQREAVTAEHSIWGWTDPAAEQMLLILSLQTGTGSRPERLMMKAGTRATTKMEREVV